MLFTLLSDIQVHVGITIHDGHTPTYLLFLSDAINIYYHKISSKLVVIRNMYVCIEFSFHFFHQHVHLIVRYFTIIITYTLCLHLSA